MPFRFFYCLDWSQFMEEKLRQTFFSVLLSRFVINNATFLIKKISVKFYHILYLYQIPFMSIFWYIKNCESHKQTQKYKKNNEKIKIEITQRILEIFQWPWVIYHLQENKKKSMIRNSVHIYNWPKSNLIFLQFPIKSGLICINKIFIRHKHNRSEVQYL